MMTVKRAVTELGVSRGTVWRWIRDTTPEQVHRERHRLPDGRGRMMPTLVVDVNALRRYGVDMLDN